MIKYCVYQDYTLRDVIEHFQENKDRVAMALNKDEKVVGTISQGDIVRALCNDFNIFTRIDKIYNPSFLYLRTKDLGAAYKEFKSKKITMMPIVDAEFKLVDVITLDDIYQYLELKR